MDHCFVSERILSSALLIGLDGCKHGAWVAARPGPDFEVITDLRQLVQQAAASAAHLVLDVPIGLIGAGRTCDAEARVLLKERRSSVFTPPCREAILATTREEASRLNFAACGKRIGCQSFGILPRIRAVDELLNSQLQQRVHEGHPEVSFAVLAGRPMQWAKKTPEGVQERLQVLAAAGIGFDLAHVRQQLKGKGVAADDIVDAAVMLATAVRIVNGQAVRFPRETSQRDDRGLLAEIWA